MGQRFTESQIRKLEMYYHIHIEKLKGHLPEWAEGAVRFYLQENPYPIRSWDHGLWADQGTLDGLRLCQMKSMMEPHLWDHLRYIESEAAAFWNSTDMPPLDRARAPIIGNYSVKTRFSVELSPLDCDEDPVIPDASIANYSTTARSSTDMRPPDRTGEPITPDALLYNDSVTAMDDRGQGIAASVAQAGDQSMGASGMGDTPLPRVFEAMAAGNKATKFFSELCDSSEAVSSSEGKASTGGAVDRFTIDV